MSTNLEYRARESERQASEAQRDKRRQRSRARDQKKKSKADIFLLKEQHEHFCSGGDKRTNARGHQCKVKVSGSEKKANENTYDISAKKRVTKTFLKVSRCSRAKQRQRNVKTKKSALHVQSCFFAN